MKNNLVVALDVGTTKVCTVIATKIGSEFQILGIGSHPSHGLKKGCVVNIEKTVQSIRNSIDEAKLMAGVDSIESATVGIAGNHIYCFNSSGIVAVKSKEITKEDVDRAIEAAKAVLIPTDREVLHVITQEFKVDNTSGIKDPIGMCGTRLEVYVHVVTGKTPLIQNLVKCVDHSGLKADEIILQPIASSRAVLSSEEKDMGVILIDIGGGTTDIAVWRDGSLVHSQILPIGGNHFTNDLAYALKIPHPEAERIKVQHGTVFQDENQSHTHISAQGLTGTKPKEVPLYNISFVLNSRAEELFNLVKQALDEQGLLKATTGGIVLTGGGALIKGLPELSEYLLEKPTKVGYPYAFGSMTNVMQNPKYSTVLGLLLESQTENEYEAHVNNIAHNDLFHKVGSSLKNAFKEIF
jgi:cell division protein FtsA